MNPFKCRHCDKPAHFYFRDGGMLCVDHAKIFCQSLTDDLMARSRLDKSVSDPVAVHGSTLGRVEAFSDVGLSAGSESNSACASLEAPPGTSSAALSGSSGTPAQERPLTSFNRSSTTMFRVAAANAIQDSVCSFSMGTAGHGAIVDAHNTIVRGG